jgi:hypothetical protein
MGRSVLAVACVARGWIVAVGSRRSVVTVTWRDTIKLHVRRSLWLRTRIEWVHDHDFVKTAVLHASWLPGRLTLDTTPRDSITAAENEHLLATTVRSERRWSLKKVNKRARAAALSSIRGVDHASKLTEPDHDVRHDSAASASNDHVRFEAVKPFE